MPANMSEGNIAVFILVDVETKNGRAGRHSTRVREKFVEEKRAEVYATYIGTGMSKRRVFSPSLVEQRGVRFTRRWAVLHKPTQSLTATNKV